MARAGAARAQARDVTDLAIGSSDWLGIPAFILNANLSIELADAEPKQI